MKYRAYRVTVVDLAKSPNTTESFATTGIEIGEDGSIYLPMIIGAKFVRSDAWNCVTITKVNDEPAVSLPDI